MPKLWKSDWVGTIAGDGLGVVQRVARNGRWADVKFSVESREHVKRMPTKYLRLKVTISTPVHGMITDTVRELSLAGHHGFNWQYCNDCRRACFYWRPCHCCRKNPWNLGTIVTDIEHPIDDTRGGLMPLLQGSMEEALMRLGASPELIQQTIGVDLADGRERTTFSFIELANHLHPVSVLIVTPSPLYDFLYAFLAEGFSADITERFTMRFLYVLEHFHVEAPSSAIRVSVLPNIAAIMHIDVAQIPDATRHELLQHLHQHTTQIVVLGVAMHREPEDELAAAAAMDNATAELIDLAKKGDRATFAELAQTLGIPREKHDEVWDGILKRRR